MEILAWIVVGYLLIGTIWSAIIERFNEGFLFSSERYRYQNALLWGPDLISLFIPRKWLKKLKRLKK